MYPPPPPQGFFILAQSTNYLMVLGTAPCVSGLMPSVLSLRKTVTSQTFIELMRQITRLISGRVKINFRSS